MFATFDYAGAVVSGGLAITVAFRAGRSFSRWAFAVGMFLLATESIFSGLSRAAEVISDVIRWQTWRVVAVATLPGAWLIFSLNYAREKKSSVAKWGIFALPLATALPAGFAFYFREYLIVSAEPITWGTHWVVRLGTAGITVFGLLLVGSVGVVMNLERTFRASVGTMRWRIKFMLLGVGVLFVVRIYTSSQVLLYRGFESSLDSLNSGALILAALLMLRSFFRAGHFDLEVYPSQSVLQNSITVLLAGAYLLIVGLLAKIVTHIGADAAFASKAFLILVSLVLLAIVLQSDRARLQLRQFVSRNFRRSAYDYRAVWTAFTAGTTSGADKTDLCRGLLRLVAGTFQALSVSIWLFGDKKDALALTASTYPISESTGKTELEDAAALTKHFQNKPQPIVLEHRTDDWAERLKQCHPTEFAKGGHRVCAPIIARGNLLGVLIVGDRVGGVPFSVDDFDMLNCVADHVGASVLNVQLSTKLLEGKQLEAFQAMAAFFVHDLKNAASTLNLMLQNLPVHFDDPAFREDALRGISKTAAHINRLIGRLGSLRHELKIETTEADLNELVNSVLGGLDQAQGRGIVKEIGPLPNVLIDRDQMQKVVTNLVLNATEAVGTEGQVRIATNQENGWAVLTVADNGCGMSADFIAHSLFRPFHTTKKNGLGIGMFQSKTIVEAHGGKISVASEAGKGTTFRVFLRTPLSR